MPRISPEAALYGLQSEVRFTRKAMEAIAKTHLAIAVEAKASDDGLLRAEHLAAHDAIVNAIGILDEATARWMSFS